MAKTSVYPFDFFVLQYNDGAFECVNITCGNFSGLSIAKIYALTSFDFSDVDVPVIMDAKSVMHYYHPVYKTWYKNLKDCQLRLFFPWLVSSEGENSE